MKPRPPRVRETPLTGSVLVFTTSSWDEAAQRASEQAAEEAAKQYVVCRHCGYEREVGKVCGLPCV